MEIFSDESQTFQLRDRRAGALGNLNSLPDELICSILDYLNRPDIARLACVSSVMYIFCNEEPLWMNLCLKKVNVPLQYQGSWKKTTLHLENLPNEYIEYCRKPLQFDGFSSLFLYRRLYRCHATLDGFSFDDGNVERQDDLSAEWFHREYDGNKPVLITGLADTWPARNTWTIDKLLLKYGDTEFRISQRTPGKVSMKFKDYVSYMKQQHDEDPLYIFDDKFGESAPGLLKDYNVPQIFQEDFFDVLDRDSRPPFRWLIIGPERSGASWHVDPALTSAWNTLLCGRKRWALYPPGRVPLGVTLHVNDEDGDVNIDSPTSLQWWLDFYPLLADEDKPIECTQLPGETIFVPSGWWHCVLNLETTVAVTQNFGACLALNADKWLERLGKICSFHNLPFPNEDEKLPVGTGSNPVYVMDEYVVKIFVEGGLESSIYGLGTELEFYSTLCEVNSPLKNHIPNVLASGILHLENGSCKIDSWDGKEVLDVIGKCHFIPEKGTGDVFPFGVRNKKLFEYRKAGSPEYGPDSSAGSTSIWPYLITKRCKGKIFAQLRDVLLWEDVLNLTSFLGEQLRNLHILPYPSFSNSTVSEKKREFSFANGMNMDFASHESDIPVEWEIFVRTLSRKKKDVSSRLNKWGDPIPKKLIEKVDEYLPDDFLKLLSVYEDNGMKRVSKPCSWIHSDIMDDNIYMEPCCMSCSNGNTALENNGSVNGHNNDGEGKSWRPNYILDFSNLSIGDPIYDLIPIHLDVFRGDSCLFKQFLQSYKLPLMRKTPEHGSMTVSDKFGRLSYHAMCYCILHDDNVLGAIFSIWTELRAAESWEEVEQTVWGELNNYQGFA
ncbi:hypothetical protein REPUB_Repub02eG0081900 [Reevesia pubescens]